MEFSQLCTRLEISLGDSLWSMLKAYLLKEMKCSEIIADYVSPVGICRLVK